MFHCQLQDMKDCTVHFSMVEVYMEKARDLFHPNSGHLKLKTAAGSNRHYFDGLTRNAFASHSELMEVVDDIYLIVFFYKAINCMYYICYTDVGSCS